MWHRIKGLIAITMSIVVASCAASPQQFASTSGSMSDTRVCQTWLKANKGNDSDFQQATSAEISRRGLWLEQCKHLINKQRLAIGAAIVVVTAVAVAVAKSDGGGGSSGGTAVSDYDWDWDQFRNEYGQTMTRCRGVQTGQFANDSRCAGKLVGDFRWPGLDIR